MDRVTDLRVFLAVLARWSRLRRTISQQDKMPRIFLNWCGFVTEFVLCLVGISCSSGPRDVTQSGVGGTRGGGGNAGAGVVPSGGSQLGSGGMGGAVPGSGGYAAGGSESGQTGVGGFGGGGVTGTPSAGGSGGPSEQGPRTRVLFNEGWRFREGDPAGLSGLSYAEARQWVLPTGNRFLKDPAARTERPAQNLGDGLAVLAADFDDQSWEPINLPHDYAIDGPYTDSISSSMGRLPSVGVAWYRKTFLAPSEADRKSVSLEIDGAMQESLVWVNGRFVGGWPYGYASFRVDLTDHVIPGAKNVVAIRLSNPVPPNNAWDSGSSRWYPGAGIYRNVWLVTAEPVHVAHWGTTVTTPEITAGSATVELEVTVDNTSDQPATVDVSSDLQELDQTGALVGGPVSAVTPVTLTLPAHSSGTTRNRAVIANPKLWGVRPNQVPNRYAAITRLFKNGVLIDRTETRFGVRSIQFDGQGFTLNGERMKIQGVCLHHDLGALGAAANRSARERQLAILAEMGANGLRTAHNPFEPEFYELADQMGFLVMDEAFDVWVKGKAALDHHRFFEDWYEQDLRALIRRDRNHPSVVMWSIGNELVEQSDSTEGPAWAERLTDICHEEDATRPTVAGMNRAEPNHPFSGPIDTIGLNYQGTGVRDRGAQYPTYHAAFPSKFIVGTETTSTFSTRGTYLFPVSTSRGTPALGSSGTDTLSGTISSYDLYHADWSYSPDEEFESQDKWPYVGGEFVWTGFDYLGEPTPLDAVARSSYFGIVDLAGFRKDRFYLYQAQWRPKLPMVHILPHWTWPERVGQVTPVHVYTSGDSAELFVNDVSQGVKTKGQYEYRLRWDNVVYAPGRLRVVATKEGAPWASATVETAGAPAKLVLSANRQSIQGTGHDLAFVTATVVDDQGRLVPRADHPLIFRITGPGAIVATDNGDPTSRQLFSSNERRAFNGMALAIVGSQPNQSGTITVEANSPGLVSATAVITAQ